MPTTTLPQRLLTIATLLLAGCATDGALQDDAPAVDIADELVSTQTATSTTTACIPRTCITAGRNCGTISNGCGGTLSCGGCNAPETCGGGGTANLCGAPAPSEWTWAMSGIAGGGLGQVIATDPFNTRRATLGGDSWGVYRTTNAGNNWNAATKGLNPNLVSDGLFHFGGIAYSRRHRGLVYGVTGRPGDTTGAFVAITGNMTRVITTAIHSAEPNHARQDKPRPTGNRVIVDFDAASGVEYLYVATGNNGGVKRSTDDGRTWSAVGLAGAGQIITGMALDPADRTVLYVGTQRGAYRIEDVRGTGRVTRLANAPARVEEISAVGSRVFAVAHTSGVYRLSSRGDVWTKLAPTFFTATSEWSAIGGAGDVVYAGCANPAQGRSVAKSIDGGNTWRWVSNDPTKISLIPWGRSEPWWLGTAYSRIVLGNNTYEATSIAVDQFDPNIVYIAGRSGAWKSEDGGVNWRPAVNGVGGTMHNRIVARPGGGAITDDVDWTGQTTSNHFFSAQHTSQSFSDTQATLDLSRNGHRYQITADTPRDFLVDGRSIASEWFRATCVRPTDIDVSADGQYIYVAQFGGGVIVARRTGSSWP